MNDFKVGERVEYVGPTTTHMIGKVGVVVEPPFANAGMVYFDHGGGEHYGAYSQNLRRITTNRAEDAPAIALDALELHGVPPTDTGGWRTAEEQSFKETSDADLVYTAWLFLKALSLRNARKQAAEEAATDEKEAAVKLNKRRDELLVEFVGVDHGDWEDHVSPLSKRAIDRIIELEDAAK